MLTITAADPLLNRFLGTLHHLSLHTREAYARDLEQLLRFRSERGVNKWRELDAHGMRAFVAWRHRRGASGRSIQRALSAVRAFYRFLIDEAEADSNPAVGIAAPKAERKLPKSLDPDQTAQLLSIEQQDPLSVRDKAMLELLYSSGLRVAELVTLELRDLDLKDAQVQVTGKGNKRRNIPVGRFARQALNAWLSKRSQMAAPQETAVFVGRRGARLTTRSVQQRLRRWAIRQGLPAHVHPHMLRHSFASHMLESSGDLRAVQELLGHADISTTQVYTHLDFQHLAKIYDEAHPRARKK